MKECTRLLFISDDQPFVVRVLEQLLPETNQFPFGKLTKAILGAVDIEGARVDLLIGLYGVIQSKVKAGVSLQVLQTFVEIPCGDALWRE
jgi:hypothetical protein